jgi:hypothetical protein
MAVIEMAISFWNQITRLLSGPGGMPRPVIPNPSKSGILRTSVRQSDNHQYVSDLICIREDTRLPGPVSHRRNRTTSEIWIDELGDIEPSLVEGWIPVESNLIRIGSLLSLMTQLPYLFLTILSKRKAHTVLRHGQGSGSETANTMIDATQHRVERS